MQSTYRTTWCIINWRHIRYHFSSWISIFDGRFYVLRHSFLFSIQFERIYAFVCIFKLKLVSMQLWIYNNWIRTQLDWYLFSINILISCQFKRRFAKRQIPLRVFCVSRSTDWNIILIIIFDERYQNSQCFISFCFLFVDVFSAIDSIKTEDP